MLKQSLRRSGLRALVGLRRRGRDVTRNGEVVAPALHDEAEIFVDRWGIPHVYARNLHDLFFLNGYVHAWDRLWQMDFMRRAACGTLAELLGPDALVTDRFARRVGFARRASAEGITGDSKIVLDAYVAGINWYIDSTSRPPIEFAGLGQPPTHWQSRDVLALSGLLSFMLTPNWDLEVIRARLLGQGVSADDLAAMEGLPAGHYEGPGMGEGFSLHEVVATEFKRLFDLGGGFGASNAWALAGARTASGKPILGGDPHLRVGMPNIWHQVHLSAGDVDVIGAAIPGTPGVLIGHNRSIAWSVTAGCVDCTDIFIEEGGPGETVREEILVKGQAANVEEVYVGRNGPDIAPAIGIEGQRWCLRCEVPGGPEPFAPLLSILRSDNWYEFREALRGWRAPVLNFVCADADGNIGHQVAGLVPGRGQGLGLLPTTVGDEGGWSGSIPFDELPMSANPDCGYVISANNAPGADYPYWLGVDFAEGYRAGRIRELVEAKEKHSPLDVSRMQLDVESPAACEVRRALLDFHPSDAGAERLLAMIKAWDCRLTADSAAACAYTAFMREFSRRIGTARLGAGAEFWMGKPVNPLARENGWLFRHGAVVVQALSERPDGLFDDREAEIAGALGDAFKALERTLGPDPDAWRYGSLHPIHLRHVASSPQNSALLDRGPYDGRGDSQCISAVGYAADGDFEAYHLPGFRQVCDLGDLSQGFAVMPGGQSGDPLVGHYNDLTPLWHAGRMHRQYFVRTDVVRHAESTLRLLPGRR
ncbi:MAG: hypothetical protein GEU28_04615 [Dehalococcoidia bacterium]|nr:hypothetical protein [Dehalococcoidia bacterium]